MINFKCITDINDAKNYWEQFSPNTELYDSWEFRYTYWQFTKPNIFFYVGLENDEPFGLLPLQWNENGYLEFFGGDFMSYNELFIRDTHQHLKAEFLKHIDKPVYLRWMKSPIPHEDLITSEKSTYYLPLIGLESLDDYFQKFLSPTRKKQIRKEMRKILNQNTELLFNNFDDLELLVDLNRKKFGEDSVFHKPYRYEFFKEIINKFDANMLTVIIDNEKVAVGLRISFNNILYGINTGVKEGTSNLGKFLYLKAIEFGIENKREKYDALEGAYGWKEIFGFSARPQYHLDLRKR